jgi:hypothetical protein
VVEEFEHAQRVVTKDPVPGGRVHQAVGRVLVEVVPGAERAAGAAEDDDRHAVVRGRVRERGGEPFDEIGVQRVQGLRAVHRQPSNPADVLAQENGLGGERVRHRDDPSGSGRAAS